MTQDPTINIDMPDASCFHFAETAGMIEYLRDMGDSVTEGQPIARIWPADRTGVAPQICTAGRSGILAARHVPGLVKMGDFVGLVAVVLD